MHTCLLTTFPGRSVHSPVKYVFFTVAYNIRPKFGRTFGTRSVSLPKPSASAECYSLTFGPSLADISALVQKCLGTEVSWVRSVLTPSDTIGPLLTQHCTSSRQRYDSHSFSRLHTSHFRHNQNTWEFFYVRLITFSVIGLPVFFPLD